MITINEHNVRNVYKYFTLAGTDHGTQLMVTRMTVPSRPSVFIIFN